MGRVVIEHLSGSKSGQTEYFEIDAAFKEIIIGRDDISNIKYDPDRDDLVGRQHAKITRDEQDINKFVILDLSSRNGTFVNNQRINSKTALWNGDKVQFGVGGPELVFKLDPPANSQPLSSSPGVKPTRDGSSNKVSETRQVEGSNSAITGPRSVFGKRTVEIMLQQVRGEGRKNLLLFGGAIVVLISIISGIFGYYFWQSQKSQELLSKELSKEQSKKLTPTQIVELYSRSVVYIEVAWKLNYAPTGQQVYQKIAQDLGDELKKLIENYQIKTKQGKIPNALPAFLKIGNKVEPWLGTDPTDFPIGGQSGGSGFVIASEGFILSNSHVVAPWENRYNRDYYFPLGVLYDIGKDSKKPIGFVLPRQGEAIDLTGSKVGVELDFNWIPSATEQAGRGTDVLEGTPQDFRGTNDLLNVIFPKDTISIPAKLSRVSNQQDVAMIKIDIPELVKPVNMVDTYDATKLGDSVTILGYPDITPKSRAIVESKDVFNRGRQRVTVQVPTLSTGNIGNIIRGDLSNLDKGKKVKSDTVYEAIGDLYQLTTNSTGAGNSGGPVFDEQGNVIGIFTYTSTDKTATVTYAVPIRYGIQLKGTSVSKDEVNK